VSGRVRVALVGPYPAQPGRFSSGVESSFAALLAGLEPLDGLEIDVLTFTRGAAARQTPDGGGVRVHRLVAPQRLNNVTFYRAARRALARALDELQPDVVHAQNALAYGYVSLKAARHIPVVVTVHGIVREERKLLTDVRDRLQVSVAGVAVERYCIRHASYLIQSTSYPEEYFGREISGRIFDVGNAIPDSLFALQPTPEQGRVLFAGAVAPRKRVHDAVEAIARVPGASLRIAGGTPDRAYAAALAERVRALGLENRVELLGPLPAERMIAEYQRASLVVLPSAQETSPLVIGEAMAAAVPVVATPAGGIRHLVEDGHTGFVGDLGDTESLAQRIAQLLGDERLRSSFASAARLRAERFRPAAVAARVLAVYEEATH
jgi:glycosyltransferase involved in cell wall biosynthesis